jgi:hypothetical protein
METLPFALSLSKGGHPQANDSWEAPFDKLRANGEVRLGEGSP